QDGQVGLGIPQPSVALRQDPVPRRREPHHPLAMYGSGLVDVAARQGKGKFSMKLSGGRTLDLRHAGYRTHLTRSKPSMTMVASSVTTSLDPALRLPVVSLEGHALMKFQRAISPAS